ncbi:hypothetical protein [Musicola keenii]|uniref:hypothetical protein n=1 Tax=Musicola keenii TaxID=2884250 RepID=UPI0022AB3D21|nr:hypothetical protein [Musicola keenii]
MTGGNPPRRQDNERGVPLVSLLALAMAAFITILTEALPAGLLSHMAWGLAMFRFRNPGTP